MYVREDTELLTTFILKAGVHMLQWLLKFLFHIFLCHLFFCREPGKFDSFIKLERYLIVSSFEKFPSDINNLVFKLLYLAP